MDIINEETKHAQLVKVVDELKAIISNSSDNPLPVVFDINLISGSGANSALRVYPVNTSAWVFSRPAGTNLNLHISSVHVVNAGVGSVFPIDLHVYSITSSAVVNNVNSVYGTFVTRFPNATSIVIFYETTNSAGTVDSTSYSADD